MDNPTLEPSIDRTALRKLLGVSSETFRVWRKTGKIPAPDVNISRQCQRWHLSTLKSAGINLWASV